MGDVIPIKVPDIDEHIRAGGTFDPDQGDPANPAAEREAASRPRVITVREAMGEAWDRASTPDSALPCTTGHYLLDRYTGGLRPGHVWVVGADTSWGKSSWVIAFADDNMRAPRSRRIAIVTVEDAPEMYGRRLIQRRSGVNATRLRDRRLHPDEMSRVAETVNAAEPLPFVLDARGRPAEWIVKVIPRIIAEHKLDVVVVDYLQEVRMRGPSEARREEVSRVAGDISGAIKAAGASGILLSQLTIQDPSKPPSKHSIRESRDVSNAAEAVMLGWCPTEDAGQFKKGERYMLVDKAKDGTAKKWAKLDWHEESASFRSSEDPGVGGDPRLRGDFDDVFDDKF